MSPLLHYLKWRIGLARAETQTTEAERNCLAVHAAGKRRLVEIGVWHGVTTCRLRAGMAAAGVLYAVDPYPVGRLGVNVQRPIARAVVERVRNGRVEWLRLTGAEAAMQLTEPVDLVFIDGDHSYAGLKADWESWSGLIAPGGVVALHDSRSTPTRSIDDAGSVRYTREVIAADRRFVSLELVDSLTVLRRDGA